ncbi:tyrosine-type recombinase/integrase [Aquincola sp. S2]|uniref:Tyrosine-type recombinase/integrase n=1 Tax=Pseudaquabacterium terrae TaxID=2732868 RepID=A0ABX2ES49_9BURK|nr:tyrosine-type recombinase/integrase [Aquabacterium terrae]
MKTRRSVTVLDSQPTIGDHGALPDSAELAALRAWHEGEDSREAVDRYLADRRAHGESARGVIGRIRARLEAFARMRHRDDLADLFRGSAKKGPAAARRVAAAVEALRATALPQPLIGDDIERWLAPRALAVLRRAGIRTLADLTVRIPRRRRWWTAVDGLGPVQAREIEAFFSAHPDLTERARVLVPVLPDADVMPFERIVVPGEVDGTRGTYRAPAATCSLRASNDYEAVQAWLSMHEAAATQRAYRKEAERLILWAIVERGCALSSLSTEDAVAYRAFLRHPSPRQRWIGPARPRSAPDWRPFTGGLSTRSVGYALTVLNALFRWLIEQRYVLANPFSGVKVSGGRGAVLDTSRVFTGSEWNLVRTIADGLEWSYGWEPDAAQRMRFILDFSYGTGLRAGELVGAMLGRIEIDPYAERWIHVIGKGSKASKVVLTPIATEALDRYLVARGLAVTPAKWVSSTPIIGSLAADGTGITTSRLWEVTKRFFGTAAGALEDFHPSLAEKLRKATPHCMRHTHATHALESGADLTTVRDNLRHASVSTTSVYLHSDDRRRAEQLRKGFGARRAGPSTTRPVCAIGATRSFRVRAQGRCSEAEALEVRVECQRRFSAVHASSKFFVESLQGAAQNLGVDLAVFVRVCFDDS